MLTFVRLLELEEAFGGGLLPTLVGLLVWVEDDRELAIAFPDLVVGRGLWEVEDCAAAKVSGKSRSGVGRRACALEVLLVVCGSRARRGSRAACAWHSGSRRAGGRVWNKAV